MRCKKRRMLSRKNLWTKEDAKNESQARTCGTLIISFLLFLILLILLSVGLGYIVTNTITLSDILSIVSNPVDDRKETIANRSDPTQTSVQFCGNYDPCFISFKEEVHDKINNVTYTKCNRFPRPMGDACSTSCVSQGTCTSFIGSSERSIPNANDRQPFCNASSPFECYGYCNSYLDCISPNVLRGKIYSDPVVNALRAFCIQSSCVYVFNYHKDIGSGAFGELYQWNIKYSWDARVSSVENMYFDYATEFCDYILYDKFDSNNPTATLNMTEYSSPKNNKGCFDYYIEWDPYVFSWCIYQYSCSRPNYFDSIRPYQWSPPNKRDLSQCQTWFTSIYTATLSVDETVDLTNENTLRALTSSLTIEQFVANSKIAMRSTSLDTNSLYWIMKNCFVTAENPSAPFMLLPRTVLVLDNTTETEIASSMTFYDGIGYISLNSTLIGSMVNVTSFKGLIRQIYNLTL